MPINVTQLAFGRTNPLLIPPFTTDRFLSIDQAAAALGCHRDTVARMIKSGKLKHYRFQRFIRVKASELHELLTNGGKQHAETEYSAWVAKRKPKSKAPTAPATPSESAK